MITKTLNMPKTKPEGEYFTRLEARRIKESVAKKRAGMLKAELDKMKELHWNRCANCGWEFQEIIFKGLIIHKCFHCGGVFLNEKEFEKLCGKESTFLDSIVDLFKF